MGSKKPRKPHSRWCDTPESNRHRPGEKDEKPGQAPYNSVAYTPARLAERRCYSFSALCTTARRGQLGSPLVQPSGVEPLHAGTARTCVNHWPHVPDYSGRMTLSLILLTASRMPHSFMGSTFMPASMSFASLPSAYIASRSRLSSVCVLAGREGQGSSG